MRILAVVLIMAFNASFAQQPDLFLDNALRRDQRVATVSMIAPTTKLRVVDASPEESPELRLASLEETLLLPSVDLTVRQQSLSLNMVLVAATSLARDRAIEAGATDAAQQLGVRLSVLKPAITLGAPPQSNLSALTAWHQSDLELVIHGLDGIQTDHIIATFASHEVVSRLTPDDILIDLSPTHWYRARFASIWRYGMSRQALLRTMADRFESDSALSCLISEQTPSILAGYECYSIASELGLSRVYLVDPRAQNVPPSALLALDSLAYDRALLSLEEHQDHIFTFVSSALGRQRELHNQTLGGSAYAQGFLAVLIPALQHNLSGFVMGNVLAHDTPRNAIPTNPDTANR